MRDLEIAILGAGMSGLCMGIALKRAGLGRFTLYEKGGAVGGTWRDNTYPGVACDVPSHLYSYSFAPNPDWSRVYSPGAEIQAYFERCADRYGLRPHIRLETPVEGAAFDEATGRWRLALAGGGEAWADVLVSAVGALHVPNIPEFPGAETFAGPLFHSARWPQGLDPDGRRFAVIGSAASAAQIVPAIAGRAAHVDVYQRTPNWIIPRDDRAYPASWKRAFHRYPWLARLHRAQLYWMLESRWPVFVRRGPRNDRERRLALRHLERQVPDPALRVRLTPDYPPGCKRILVSDDYYPALMRDDVALVTEPIARIAADGVVTADGVLRPADVVVLATGFRASEPPPIAIAGRGGTTLADTWRDGLFAHRTVGVPGFPNLFLLLGPNSGLGHSSIILMVEAQVRYVMQCLIRLAEEGWRSIEPRAEAAARFADAMQRGLEKTIWHAGCRSWYQDAGGRIGTLWPHSTVRYRHEMRRVRFGEYHLRGAP